MISKTPTKCLINCLGENLSLVLLLKSGLCTLGGWVIV